MPNRMNARQRRHAKARLKALQDAIARNPSSITVEGSVRASTTGAKALIIETTWHGFAKGRKSAGMIPQRPVTIEGSKIGAHEGVKARPPNPKFRVEGSVKLKERFQVTRVVETVTTTGRNIDLHVNPLNAPHRKVSGFDSLRLAAAKRKLVDTAD